MGTPEEVAALAHYLCSDEASFITGQAYPIDGGVLVTNEPGSPKRSMPRHVLTVDLKDAPGRHRSVRRA